MDQHPDQSDLDAPVSNPEAEENRLVHRNEESEFESEGEEEEEEDEGEESEDPSGLTAMNQLHVTGPDRRSPEEEMIIARMRRQQEERKYLEQKESLMRDDYLSSPPAHFPGNGSKSTTPSPSSPPQQQYLYAANLLPMLDPKLKQDMATAMAMVNVAQQRLPLLPSTYSHLGGGDSSTGSATPPNNGISLTASPRPGDQDQSKYTFEEQFKQVLEGYSSSKNKNRTIIPDGESFKKVIDAPPCTSKKKVEFDLVGYSKLYEISDDPGRKEFLDDLFNFMQRLGKPVNRIPIMAKQVLDLYELYRLVVARGGLVEVINKKIWREITKGLNLPSSITSAAFTLRTQYMKYLYAYECEKERLSTQEELQAAIDGNRREGRRAGYSPYGDMVPPRNNHHPPLPSHASPLSLVSRHMNGHGPTRLTGGGGGPSSPLPLSYYTPPPPQHNNNNSTQLPLNLAPPQENGLYNSNHTMSSGGQAAITALAAMTKREEENCNSVPSTPNPLMMPQQEALNLEVSRNSDRRDHKPLNMASSRKNHNPHLDDHASPKRLKVEDDRLLSKTSNMPSTNIRITSNSHPDGRSLDDGSLMVSMEVNGTMYTGVLYASRIPKNRH